jgi:hypothetical protein
VSGVFGVWNGVNEEYSGASKEISIMSSSRVALTIGALGFCLAAMLTTSGCITSRADVTYGPKGPPAGHSTLRQVKVGQTSKEWLLGTLGEPTRVTQTAEGTEILTYEYTKTVDGDFKVFLLLNSRDRREERTVYTFELRDGIVTKYWKD